MTKVTTNLPARHYCCQIRTLWICDFWKEQAKIRVLISFEEEYRSFRDTIAEAFRALRPGDEVEVSGLGTLGEEVTCFKPHLVIASLPNAFDPDGQVAWVQLSPDPDRPSKVCVGGRHSQALNPSMQDLLSVAGEAEALIGDGYHPRPC